MRFGVYGQATNQPLICLPVAADVIAAMLASPADYYVNVHSAAFPKGPWLPK